MVDILHIDNLRDLETDLAVGVHTIALGDSDAKRLHHAYVGGAYATTFALVACSRLSPWTLIVVAGLPRALALSRDVARSVPAASTR